MGRGVEGGAGWPGCCTVWRCPGRPAPGRSGRCCLPPCHLTFGPLLACYVPGLQGASGPVHAVLTENMAAYHFWSSEAHRWQMATVELYDASPPTLK